MRRMALYSGEYCSRKSRGKLIGSLAALAPLILLPFLPCDKFFVVTIESLYQIFLKHPSVQTDTRRLKDGDIFFALKGPNFNANLFAKKALESGAAYAVVDEAIEDPYPHEIGCGDGVGEGKAWHRIGPCGVWFARGGGRA